MCVKIQGVDESGGVQVQVRPALLRVRLDTLTSIISEIDISDEEEENGIGPLHPTALWVRLWCKNYKGVVSGCHPLTVYVKCGLPRHQSP